MTNFSPNPDDLIVAPVLSKPENKNDEHEETSRHNNNIADNRILTSPENKNNEHEDNGTAPGDMYSDDQKAFLIELEKEAKELFPSSDSKYYESPAALKNEVQRWANSKGFFVTDQSNSIMCRKHDAPKRRPKQLPQAAANEHEIKRRKSRRTRCSCPFRIRYSKMRTRTRNFDCPEKAVRITSGSVYLHDGGCYPCAAQLISYKKSSPVSNKTAAATKDLGSKHQSTPPAAIFFSKGGSHNRKNETAKTITAFTFKSSPKDDGNRICFSDSARHSEMWTEFVRRMWEKHRSRGVFPTSANILLSLSSKTAELCLEIVGLGLRELNDMKELSVGDIVLQATTTERPITVHVSIRDRRLLEKEQPEEDFLKALSTIF